MLKRSALMAIARSLRTYLSMALAVAFLLSAIAPSFADSTTGSLSGTVVGADNHAIANAAVTATAPSGTFRAKTNADGFFSLIGLPPDTYVVGITFAGYQATVLNGVTVNATQTTNLGKATLARESAVIGRSASRSTTTAFQPQQTTDTYSVNSNQIDTLLGKPKATNEADLLARLPGATLDSSGYPVLRGGRENEEGFQFEGIDYTDAFTSQFVNSLYINGPSSFQLTPGAGDAATGNVGTGQINITLKRGSKPAFGSADFEAQSPAYAHQFSIDYGFATPNGRFSDYFSFIGQRYGQDYGPRGSDLAVIGRPISQNYSTSNDFVNNAIFKFGQDNNQSLQLVYQGQANNFHLNINTPTQNFKSGDPLELTYYSLYTGFSTATVGSLLSYYPGQTSQNQPLTHPAINYDQPNQTLKLQYSNNLNATTYLTAKLYKVNAVVVFDFPYANAGFAFADDFYLNQGGQRSGSQIDLTKQLGDKNLIGIGAKYEISHPVDSYQSATYGLLNTLFDAGGEVFDFVSKANGGTGYLAPYFPNGVPRLPPYNQTAILDRQDFSVYIKDDIQVSKQLKIAAGFRLDSANYHGLPSANADAYLPASGLGYASGQYYPTISGVYPAGTIINGVDVSGKPDPNLDQFNTGGNKVKNPFIPEPRLGIAYQFTPHDSVSASYARSVQLAAISFLDVHAPRSQYAQFSGIPSTINSCGPTGDRQCKDYADQLYWANQNGGDGVPTQPIKPSTFTNLEAAYSHDFGHGVAVKLTPYYRRGYDGFASVQTQRVSSTGQPIFNADGSPSLLPAVSTNLGISRTSGVEFYLTKDAQYGLSGSLSATYINELTNVIPVASLGGSEDFFPSIPPASLGLGNQYRVGFLSPFNLAAALSYKTHSGIRINPVLTFNRGYPYGNGSIAAALVNGVYRNIPQTNITNQAATFGSQDATNYVDPQNPGTVLKPNIAASRGTPEGPSAGTYLSHPRLSADASIEYSKPGSRSTYGILTTNIFNQLYGQPILNSLYQPVATGISGPLSGTLNGTQAFFGRNYGLVPIGAIRNGNQPYVLSPNRQGITYRFYYQINL